MHAPLHASALDCPLRKFRIVRGNCHEARLSPLDHLSIMVIRLPDEQFSLHLIQDAQPVRFLWHVQGVEERHRFHRCSVEIVGAYRNPIQCRVRLVARPNAKELDGKIHHETALCVAPSIPRQREGKGVYLVSHKLRRLCKAADNRRGGEVDG